MGNLEKPVEFCEGCPFANGLMSSDTLLSSDVYAMSPHPRIDFQFTNSKGNTTHVVSTGEIYGDIDSTIGEATGDAILMRLQNCHSPVHKKALFGLLTKTACGAFPEQNPKKPRIQHASYGYMFEDYNW